MTEERLSTPEDTSVQITQCEQQRENKFKEKRTELPGPVGQYQTSNIHVIRVPEGEERDNRVGERLQGIITEKKNPQYGKRHQCTHLRSLVNSEEDKY